MSEVWFVTGASGCIGAWTVFTLLQQGAEVIALERGNTNPRLRLIGGDECRASKSIDLDVRDLKSLERALGDNAVTHVVHLAALQAPFCRADPPLGAEVNVVGTANVFEAVRRHGPETRLVYASSAGVYDREGRTFTPTTIYGIYKVANEGTARLYWQESQVPSIGLRPNVVYGAGRDRGLSAAPSQAMIAASRGEPFHISFGGSTQLQYGADVAGAFIAAARREPEGAAVYNLGGPEVAIAKVVETIQQLVPEAHITFEGSPLPFTSRLPEPWFEMPTTGLESGVAETIGLYRRAAGFASANGR
jgi:UDP-glucuronate 4-epimerase